jgi:UDPglucose 6-dehydrogenase
VDFAVVQSDWQEIRDIKPEDFKRLLKKPIVIDGRRTYDPDELSTKGITYRGIGWKNLED